MSPLRALAVVMLCLAVLPWGAYVHGANLAPRAGIALGSGDGIDRADGPRDRALAIAQGPGQTVAPVPAPCRKAVFGTACGLDVALVATTLPPMPDGAASRLAAMPAIPRGGAPPGGPTTPPRSA